MSSDRDPAHVRSALTGLWGFPVTPFTTRGDVDTTALQRQVSLQVSGGVDVIAGAGLLGEVLSLTLEEWQGVVATTVETVAGRVPVVVTIPPERAEERAAFAAVTGASALLVLPLEAVVADGIGGHLRRIFDRSGLGLVLYQRGDLQLEPSDLEALLDAPGLIGIKDGRRDLRRFRRMRTCAGERLLMAAAWEDLALAYWAMGADALCPASTAHDPAYARAWFDRLRAGDVAGARRLLERLAYPLTDLRLSRPGIDIAVVKGAMSVRGLEGGPVRPPGCELTSDEMARVVLLLDAFDRTEAT